jgi:hypothetical protein
MLYAALIAPLGVDSMPFAQRLGKNARRQRDRVDSSTADAVSARSGARHAMVRDAGAAVDAGVDRPGCRL